MAYISKLSMPAAAASAPEHLPDVTQLNGAAESAVAAFYNESQSANTARTYKTALQYWGAWHVLRYGISISAPVSPDVVLQFIVDHLEHNPALAPPQAMHHAHRSTGATQHLLPPALDRLLVERKFKTRMGSWTFSTVKTRLAALSKAHDRYIADHPQLALGPGANPMRDPRVRDLLKAVRRVYARRGKPAKRPNAATKNVMEILLSTCQDDLAGIRDRALLLVGWSSGGRRRSEIMGLTFENLRREGDEFLYDLRHSKTNQSGSSDPNNLKPIVGSAATALRAWLDVLLTNKITQGKIFRRILHDEIREPLADSAVRDIVRRRAVMSGQPVGNLSAHSLRSGFVTEAGKQGISLGETMALTGHKSVQTAMGYYHAGEVVKTKAAQLMDIKEPKK